MFAWKEVSLIESDQVVTLDVVDVLVLHAPAVRVIAAIDDLRKCAAAESPPGSSLRREIALRNCDLAQVELVLPELGIRQ